MDYVLKLFITMAIIIVCTQIGRRFPSLSGLISVMPITSLAVLVLLYTQYPGNSRLMADFTKGALFGIGPTVLFFLVAFLCFKKQFSLSVVLVASFSIWLAAALIHQWLLGGK